VAISKHVTMLLDPDWGPATEKLCGSSGFCFVCIFYCLSFSSTWI